MKKIILSFFCCFLADVAVSLKAQEIRPMPADSAYGVVIFLFVIYVTRGSLPPV